METETREIRKNDIETVMHMQLDSYASGYYEESKIFENMIAEYPVGCRFVLADGKPAGSIFFYPFFNDRVKDLNTTSVRITGKEDCMYIHDLNILADCRGRGLTAPLFEHLNKITAKEGFAVQALVSVQESRKFWERHGFAVTKTISYGGTDAYYMKKAL